MAPHRVADGQLSHHQTDTDKIAGLEHELADVCEQLWLAKKELWSSCTGESRHLATIADHLATIKVEHRLRRRRHLFPPSTPASPGAAAAATTRSASPPDHPRTQPLFTLTAAATGTVTMSSSPVGQSRGACEGAGVREQSEEGVLVEEELRKGAKRQREEGVR